MPEFDGVIEAVRYKGSRIELVRMYERRGATFSDHVLIDRAALVRRLQEGKRLVTGRRKALMASTFEVGQPLMLVRKNGDAIVTAPGANGRDSLEGVPIF